MDPDDLKIVSIEAGLFLRPSGEPGPEPPPRPTTPVLRARRQQISRVLRREPASEVLRSVRQLEGELPQEQKWLAYELIRFHPGAFSEIDEAAVEDYVDRVASWYATDALGTVLSGRLWAAGRLPDSMFDAWSRSDSRWRRRSALVATVGLNAVAPDPARTFPICLRLADDRDDMVEKAVSWSLRWLAQKDGAVVDAFMAEHGSRFRPRVRREVGRKLTTGRKTPRSTRA
ncbi:DNA alkylation repair protein [Phenylobacterium sp.]|uniref:DNA alkylation repair protein n=1 Tax=Phenylobacterium sp. TaxID=1871053 RepID=UPI00301DCCBF